MIAIVDFGMGNLRSVAKAIEHVAPRATVTITSDAATIRTADRVVFPGQGAMPDCMRYLKEYGLAETVREVAATKPLLAVCIGEQMLFERSEEGDTAGLGLFAGSVVRFSDDAMRLPEGARLKVPHMGWNRVQQTQRHALWEGIADDSWFYFVHSYYVVPADRADFGGRKHSTEVPLPAWSRAIIFLPPSFTRKRAPQPACASTRTSRAGIPDRVRGGCRLRVRSNVLPLRSLPTHD